MRARDYRRLVRRRRFPRRCAILLGLALGACAGGATGADGPTGTVDATAPSLPIFVVAGGSTSAKITIVRTNYDRPVSFVPHDLTTGITASFDPPTLSGATLSTTETVSAGADVPTGPGEVDAYIRGTDGLQVGFGLRYIVVQPQVRVILAGTGTGSITSDPTGIKCGSVCSANYRYGTSVTLTATAGPGSAFAGWFGGGCSGTSLTCTLAVTGTPAITATFNSTAQGFSLGVSPAAASVPQGGAAAATVHIARLNGFSGVVALAASGAPNGLTVAASPSSTTDTVATVNVAAASSVAAGNYPITITATTAGLPAEVATLEVQVMPAPGGSNNVAFSWASCEPTERPLWFAVQNGTGAWTRIMPAANSSFTFAIGATAGVAVVTPTGKGFHTRVVYGSRADLTALALGDQCRNLEPSTGSHRLTGTMTNISTASAFVAVGGASTQFPVQPGVPNPYTLDEVPGGRRDLLAVAKNTSQGAGEVAAKLIFRRDVTYAAEIPQLNFAGPEAFTPLTRAVFTNNVGTDQTELDVSFATTNGGLPTYLTRTGTSTGVAYVGLPDSLLQPGDLHVVQVLATPAGASSYRFAAVLLHALVPDTVTFGLALAQPVVATVGTSPYARLRAQLASQPDYGAMADATFSRGDNSTEVTMLTSYAGSVPATWTLEIPDLTAAGYDSAWGLSSGTVNWEVAAAGGDVLPFFGAVPSDGVRILGAGAASSASVSGTSVRRRWVRRW